MLGHLSSFNLYKNANYELFMDNDGSMTRYILRYEELQYTHVEREKTRALSRAALIALGIINITAKTAVNIRHCTLFPKYHPKWYNTYKTSIQNNRNFSRQNNLTHVTQFFTKASNIGT